MYPSPSPLGMGIFPKGGRDLTRVGIPHPIIIPIVINLTQINYNLELQIWLELMSMFDFTNI